MAYREIPVSIMQSFTEATASALGLQLKVEASDHSLSVEYTAPDKDNRAWDADLYRNGNLFVAGYANPIKPRVNHNDKLENPDTIEVTEGDAETDTDDDDSPHVSLISSSRYRDYMRQDLVSQLLTPQEQWKLIAWGILGLGVIMFVNMVLTVYVTGGF